MVSNTPQARSCCTALFGLKLQNTRQAMRGHSGKETEHGRERETTPSCTEVQAWCAWELKARGQAQARRQRLAAPEPSPFCAHSHPHPDCSSYLPPCTLSTLPSSFLPPLQSPDSVLKSRDITLLTKVCIVKAIVFPIVMYGCESWTIEKAERQRIDAFKLWCWRRLLTVPWTSRR